MKNIILLIFCGFSVSVFAQKEDNVWAFGYDSNKYPDHPGIERIFFTFNDSLSINYESESMSLFDSYASICDSAGKLILLSNGCYIEKADGISVPNSEGLNPGKLYDVQCVYHEGYNSPQSMIMLPDPTSKTKFHLFHIPNNLVNGYAYDYAILHSSLDIALNSGAGDMELKNDAVVMDTIGNDGLHAVRHANGRDWWVIGTKRFTNKYFIILLDPAGISVKEQIIGDTLHFDASGEMAFSPDGKKIALFDCKNNLVIFNFDRCTGVLSNPLEFPPLSDGSESYSFGGVAWSADNRFLYISTGLRCYQFDLMASDVIASRQLVGTYDPNISCFLNSNFFWMELGPDGVIYCRPGNGTKCMNRINHPERPGLACGVEQRALEFPYAYKNIPNFPNFRLGPIDGSACDTLGIDNHPLAGWRYARPDILTVDFTSVSWYEPEQWYWTFGDGTVSTERNPQHVFPGPGPYPVCLTVSNAYGSDTKCKTVWVTTTATEETPAMERKGEILVFPNPASERVFWNKPNADAPELVRLYNALGQLQLEKQTSDNHIDVTTMPQGIYHLVIQSASGSVRSANFVIQH